MMSREPPSYHNCYIELSRLLHELGVFCKLPGVAFMMLHGAAVVTQQININIGARALPGFGSNKFWPLFYPYLIFRA